MPIDYEEDQALFRGVASIEEAEDLLQWLRGKPTASVDFRACTHLHPVNLQVLMAAKNRVTAWPDDPNLRVWLQAALKSRL